MPGPDLFDSQTGPALGDGVGKQLFTAQYKTFAGHEEDEDGELSIVHDTQPAAELKEEVEDFLDDHQLLDYSLRIHNYRTDQLFYEVEVTYHEDEGDAIAFERIEELQNRNMTEEEDREDAGTARSRFNQRLNDFIDDHDVYGVETSAAPYYAGSQLFEAWVAYRPE
ncbi:MAG: hypothetical protein SVU32_05075 [Candidatus Nanohaloarchaea archaeon]|nr:hypothetical protein [Candidatus Nanohaloarchaea archaeon]